MSRLQVTSEIYAETDFKCSDLSDSSIISKFTCKQFSINFFFLLFAESISTFTFFYPNEIEANSSKTNVDKDKDGDLVLERKRKGEIKIG